MLPAQYRWLEAELGPRMIAEGGIHVFTISLWGAFLFRLAPLRER